MIPPAPVSLRPLGRAPDFHWRVPGSKSLTNRALILAALAEGESTLHGVLHSDDTHHMRRCLGALGIRVDELAPTTWRVHGGRSRLRPPAEVLQVGNSGTTVRFLTALAALVDGPIALAGDEHMAKRPIGDLLDALRQLGVAVDCPSGCPPLTVRGGGLPGGAVHMDGRRSSQYFSALMMAGSQADQALTVTIDGDLVSRPYVEMTAAVLNAFGGRAAVYEDRIVIDPAPLQAIEYQIEPDASAASYPMAAAIASGGRITIPGLTERALQGDVAFADLLRSTGMRIDWTADGLVATASDATGERLPLRAVDADMHHISDTVMSLAAIAPLLAGVTTIRNVSNIRIKETDRLAATVQELRRLGQTVDEGEDWLRITPAPVRPATVQCYADHRMAMSFAILGLAVEGVTIADPACVAKTYPGFWDDLGDLYRSVDQAVPW